MPARENGSAVKQRILEAASFGERIAELEMKELASYFVVTEQWRQLVAGEKDIVYGPKGSGKSALYSLLMQKEGELFDRGILVIAAEKPSGTPAFQDLAKDPPAAEHEFIVVWKLYFLSLVARALQDWDVQTPEARRVYDALRELGLLEYKSPKALLRMVRKHARRLATAESFEATVLVDPGSGAPVGISGKLTVSENGGENRAPYVPIDQLMEDADSALADADLKVWIVIDRLDVAFAEHDDLEHRALRALFKAYLDMQALGNTSLKIFLRTDIWRRITREGFREASHIAKNLTITWERTSLLNLVVRRMLKNSGICMHYDLDANDVYSSVTAQEEFINRIFPDQVDPGKHPSTFDWMLTRTQDSTGQTAPRELIHLLSSLRDSQLRLIEIGHEPPPGQQLFDRAAFKTALREVSYTRLTQTIYAEYPQMQPFIEHLEGGKTQQTISTLRGIWSVDASEARRLASVLVDIGFFEARGSKNSPVYWVPFLYRDALRMVQGEARGFLHYGRQIVGEVTQALLLAIPRWQDPRDPTRGSGPGYEEAAVEFLDARTAMPLLLWIFAADTGAPVNFPSRPSIVGAGLRRDMNTELEPSDFKIRLAGGPFRWHGHLNENQGYRTIVPLPDFATITIEDTVREFGDRLITGLRRARMIESAGRREVPGLVRPR